MSDLEHEGHWKTKNEHIHFQYLENIKECIKNDAKRKTEALIYDSGFAALERKFDSRSPFLCTRLKDLS